jgi:hypothetical protein
MGLQPFYGKGPHLLVWAGSRAARGKITISGIYNCLNYCVTFMVYIQFTNVAAGCIIQYNGPGVRDSQSTYCSYQKKKRATPGHRCAPRIFHWGGVGADPEGKYNLILKIML